MIVYSDIFLEHDFPGHPENKERLISIMDFLRKHRLLDEHLLAEPLKAVEEDILRVHSKEHFQKIEATQNFESTLQGDTYFTPQTFESALYAAGSLITCVEGESPVSFALPRPPGHHATRDTAMGFCIFNNVAVAAAYAKEKGTKKIAILDFDIHHGNGTQDIFYNSDILYISLHRSPFYPGSGRIEEIGAGNGEGFTVNIPLPAGVSDSSYKLALDEVVYPVFEDFKPDIIFYSAGYDCHFADTIGDLSLSSKIYYDIGKKSKEISKKSVFALEGGYNLNTLPYCVASTIQGFRGMEWGGYDSPKVEDTPITDKMSSVIQSVKKQVSEHWKI